MNLLLTRDLLRFTMNTALRRDDLLRSALRKSRRRKVLNLTAGILAILSAGAIAALISNLLGDNTSQIIAAIVTAVSAAITLILSSYYSDKEIFNMLNGSSKYLSLRESVYRLLINPDISDEKRFDDLTRIQNEYVRLDETYSSYLSIEDATGTGRSITQYAKYLE